MTELVVVRSKIKEHAVIGNDQLNVSGDFAECLNEKVVSLIKDAANRAQANSRRTVQGKDL